MKAKPVSKQCTRCLETKPLTEFYLDASAGRLERKSRCKECYIEINAAYAAKYRAARRAAKA